jgi:DNA invertase Pin-like site-specific DNA recombinase
MSVVGYIRFSTIQQTNKEVNAQKEVIKEYANKTLGYSDPEIIEHVCSGHKIDYSELKRLSYAIIVIFDVSRFSRSVERGIEYIKEILYANSHNSIHFISENLIVRPGDVMRGTRIYREFVNKLNEVKIESETYSRRTINGKRMNKKKGIYIGGKVPYGLKVINTRLFKIRHEMNVTKFIKLARSKRYSAKQLNNLMAKISKYNGGIILEREGKLTRGKAVEPLSCANITTLLNQYEVEYRNGVAFTPEIVRRISAGKADKYIEAYPEMRYESDIDYELDMELSSDHEDEDDELYSEFGNLSL